MSLEGSKGSFKLGYYLRVTVILASSFARIFDTTQWPGRVTQMHSVRMCRVTQVQVTSASGDTLQAGMRSVPRRAGSLAPHAANGPAATGR